MTKDDIFLAMIKEELNQYNHLYLYREKQMIKDENFKDLAIHSLKQTRMFGIAVILFIVIFSINSIYHFVQFGTESDLNALIIGVLSWALVIVSTYFYTRDIVEKKKTMERILKLLEAREEYFTESKHSHNQ
jgi:hypothetical protein